MNTIYETQHPADFSLMYDTVLTHLSNFVWTLKIETKQSRELTGSFCSPLSGVCEMCSYLWNWRKGE